MGIPLVIAEPTGMYRRKLRRFTYGREVPCTRGHTGEYNWGHDASNAIGLVPEAEADPHGDNWPHDDQRWPVICSACGYVFRVQDQWQRNDCRVFRRPDGFEFVNWGSYKQQGVPAGTMWRVEWADDPMSRSHPQQYPSWLIILPDGGQWITSQAATGGGHWTITGEPPMISATPSIWHNQPGGWHGFVTNGELVSC